MQPKLIVLLFVLAIQTQAAHSALYRFPALADTQKTLVIYSSADVAHVKQLLIAYQKLNSSVAIDYHELHTLEIYHRVISEIDNKQASADLFLSSAMDLQIKLVNDGYAASHNSAQTESLPGWANWRNEAFGFTYEPAVIIYNRALAPHLKNITSRFELANWLSKNAEEISGKVITYDPEQSGLGYLFDTQDAVQSEDFWYLVRSLGDANAQLTKSSSEMIEKVASGNALLAYNVLGSYARARSLDIPEIGITIPKDYCLIMSRIAVISRVAANPQEARSFLDYLLSIEGQKLIADPTSLSAIRFDVVDESSVSNFRNEATGPLLPINLGPGLLVYLDQMKRDNFIRRWRTSMSLNNTDPN